jgi:hydrogenase 3 maturation protease
MTGIQSLEELLKHINTETLLICGIGNSLRADDAIGPLVVADLKDDFRTLNCGSTPENYVFKIERMKPEVVLFVDAVDFSGEPGETRLFPAEEIIESRLGQPSTHLIPLGETLKMLKDVTRADVYLLGVQPRSITFGDPLSKEVEKARERIITTFRSFAPTG